MTNEQSPTYEELQRRLADAEATLQALRNGQECTIAGEHGTLVVHSAEARACVNQTETMDYLNARGQVETDSQGQILGLAGSLQDITERKQLEERIVLLSRMLDEAPAAITIHDTDGRFLFANHQTVRLHGYENEEAFLAINLHDLDVPESEAMITERIRRITEAGEARFETSHYRKDGSIFPLEITAKIINWSNRPAILSIANDLTERKRAEEALRESEAKSQLLLKHSSDLIWDLALDGVFTYASPSWSRVTGYDPEVIRGSNFTDYVHPEDIPACLKYLLEIRTLKIVASPPDYRVRHADGSWHWHEATGTPVSGQKDEIVSVVGVSRDITERKRTEEILKKHLTTIRKINESSIELGFLRYDELFPYIVKKLKAIFNVRAAWINEYDEKTTDLVIKSVSLTDAENSWAIRKLGTKIDGYKVHVTEDQYEIMKNNQVGHLSSLHELSFGAIPEIIGKSIEKLFGLEWFMPVVLINKDKIAGTFVIAGKSGQEAPDREEILAFAAITANALEHKRAEDELKNREYLLNKIFDVLPIGLWFADEKGRLIRGNPAGVKIWGAEPTVSIEEYGMFKARRLPSGKEIAPDDWALAHTIREGTTIVDELLEIDAFDGQKKIILNYTAPVFNDQGNIQGAIVVNQDISDREQLNAQLTQAQKMESIGRLAGGVAHDFNNMLGVILGHVEMAMEQVDHAQPLYADLQQIMKAAERSSDLTHQLLAFARKQTISPKVLDLNETVEGMLKMLRRLIGEDIDLLWKPGRNIRPVKMDPSQIDQILANLCVNARDAIEGVGRVTIETDAVAFDKAYCADHAGFAPGEYILLAVSDDGCGMDKETLSHLFEPFFTTKDVGKGTGLGLATVYGIVKQNSGFINVYSEPDHGSRFTIYLPRYEAMTTPTTEQPPAQATTRGSETVLLVEDELALLKMTTMMLEKQGYTVLPANTPGEAIRLVREYPGHIDLLLTDMIMPEMNGRDLAGNLLSIHPDLKCLFMSGYTANLIAHHGVLDQGVHFIQKPFSLKNLAAKLRETLDGD
jgi:PAS domain S-box-containing protein